MAGTGGARAFALPLVLTIALCLGTCGQKLAWISVCACVMSGREAIVSARETQTRGSRLHRHLGHVTVTQVSALLWQPQQACDKAQLSSWRSLTLPFDRPHRRSRSAEDW